MEKQLAFWRIISNPLMEKLLSPIGLSVFLFLPASAESIFLIYPILYWFLLSYSTNVTELSEPISLKTAWIVTKLGHFKIFSQYPCVTAAALWYPQWTIAQFFWLAAESPAPQSQNIAWRSAAGRQLEAARRLPIYLQSGTGTSSYSTAIPVHIR